MNVSFASLQAHINQSTNLINQLVHSQQHYCSNTMHLQVMSPAESGEYIAKNAKHAKVHQEGIDKLTKEMLLSMKQGKLAIPDTGAKIMHPAKNHPRASDWIFVLDTLNFCFWSCPGQSNWTVEGHTGYYALEAALQRASLVRIDVTDPKFYSRITSDRLKYVMRGDEDGIEIPLLTKRLEVLHEVGNILNKRYHGTFETCIKEANKSAVKLLEIVVANFPCFQDEAVYNGTRVTFYKRAQILVADLWNFFGGTGWGEFRDIDKLTMFADYRVPQVLVYFGAMSYSDELMERLKNDELLPSGSDEEIEIRGCSIHAVQLLTRKLRKELKGKEGQELKGEEGQELKGEEVQVEVPNACLIDYYLWCYRRKYREELDAIPFHKTVGIFY